jgi:hypothetical protein
VLAIKHPGRPWSAVGGGLALLLAAIAVLAITASSHQRGDVLAQLERPAARPATQAGSAATLATLTVGPGAVHLRTEAGGTGSPWGSRPTAPAPVTASPSRSHTPAVPSAAPPLR